MPASPTRCTTRAAPRRAVAIAVAIASSSRARPTSVVCPSGPSSSPLTPSALPTRAYRLAPQDPYHFVGPYAGWPLPSRSTLHSIIPRRAVHRRSAILLLLWQALGAEGAVGGGLDGPRPRRTVQNRFVLLQPSLPAFAPGTSVHNSCPQSTSRYHCGRRVLRPSHLAHLLGHARVSAADQQPHLQADALEGAGCYQVLPRAPAARPPTAPPSSRSWTSSARATPGWSGSRPAGPVAA